MRVASVAASRHCQTLATCLRKREHNCRAAAGRATIHSVSRRDDGGQCGGAAQHSSRMHRSGHQRKYLNTGSGFLWRFNELADISWVDLGTKQLRQLVFSIQTAREDFDIAGSNIGVLCYNKHFIINMFNVEMSSLDCIWLATRCAGWILNTLGPGTSPHLSREIFQITIWLRLTMAGKLILSWLLTRLELDLASLALSQPGYPARSTSDCRQPGPGLFSNYFWQF